MPKGAYGAGSHQGMAVTQGELERRDGGRVGNGAQGVGGGAGAVAATIAFALELGATRGHLAHYTTSHEVAPMGPASDMVGYGAVVFVA